MSSMSNRFEQKVIYDENQKLIYYTEKHNQEQTNNRLDNLILNLSLSQIFKNWSLALISILEDLTEKEINNWREFVIILTTKNRIIYLGITLLMIAMAIYIFDITS
jgi:hypothetical protein